MSGNSGRSAKEGGGQQSQDETRRGRGSHNRYLGSTWFRKDMSELDEERTSVRYWRLANCWGSAWR